MKEECCYHEKHDCTKLSLWFIGIANDYTILCQDNDNKSEHLVIQQT